MARWPPSWPGHSTFRLAGTDFFSDDNGSTHEDNINRIREAGITTGFPDGTYRSTGYVTRSQMGSFIARAMGLEPIPGDRFADVSGTHAENINAIAQAGVTLGCNSEGTLYCPEEYVRRDQMASFIARALGVEAIEVPVKRSLLDRPDVVSGYQVHLIYALPQDGLDQQLDTNGVISTSVGAAQSWFTQQTGGPRIRFDTFGDSDDLDITFIRFPLTDAEITGSAVQVFYALEDLLTAAGFSQANTNKLYVVYYGGATSDWCGIGGWFVGVFPNGAECAPGLQLAPNVDTPGYAEFVLLHEMVHTLGFVPTCAPNYFVPGPWHVDDDPRDLMWSGRAGQSPWELPPILDVGRDDYFGHGRDDCPDLLRSPLLDQVP